MVTNYSVANFSGVNDVGEGATGNPTVGLYVEAYVHIGGDLWGWRPIKSLSPAGAERVLNEAEMVSTLRVYGRMLADRLDPKEIDAYRVVAYKAPPEEHILGVHSWSRSELTNDYRPDGDPWTVPAVTAGCPGDHVDEYDDATARANGSDERSADFVAPAHVRKCRSRAPKCRLFLCATYAAGRCKRDHAVPIR